MITTCIIWVAVTVLIYRWLYVGAPVSGRTRWQKARDIALRVALAIVFPFLGLWLLFAYGVEGITSLFHNQEMVE